MEHLIAVVALVAIATFFTGLLLPLGARRSRDPEVAAESDEAVAGELSAWS